MTSYFKTIYVLVFAVVFVFACEGNYDSLVEEQLEENPTPDEVSGDAGSADFSNYVAIGNSLTAGYMDGALYNMGQEYSLAALLHQQMQLAGGSGNFNQPDINSELGFNTSVDPNPQNGTILGRYKLDTSIPGPSPTVGGDEIASYDGNTAELNNFGVPGIVVGQLLTEDTGNPQTQAYNPFYARFASSPGSSTIIGDVLAAQPSFFTLWIGNNDVLGYAISGASNPNILTAEQDFENYFNKTVDQLLNNSEASGIVATIPPVTAIPFFQAVSYDAIELAEEEAMQLNQALAGVNDALDAVAANFPNRSQEDMDARKINYQEGNNPILVNDPALDDLENEFDALGLPQEQRQALVPYEQSRPLTADELVTLSAGSVLGTEYNPQSETPTTIGVVIPLGFDSQSSAFGDAYYLTVQEQVEIQNRTTAFNTTIATKTAQHSDRLALFDINAGFPGNPNTEMGAFADLFGIDGELGIRVQGTLLQPDFSPNGVFSTDGIHPNARGNAILANEFIKVIEDAFGADIPDVDVLNLPSVQLCAGDCVSQQQQKTVAEIGKITFDM
ncbi:SGNH/GDSL hydrolase family protein [Fodinibius sp. Rm-B-1B1-1]|uniref:SGNH/GDSL hydrolase family protein n=1 Tax=Fodinibius alkaliphilus TaxID=3140241 RepID=UPI00315A4B12